VGSRLAVLAAALLISATAHADPADAKKAEALMKQGIEAYNKGHALGNPPATPADAAWPLQHPVIAAVFWSIAFLAVAAPLTIWLFKKRTTE